jgi:hypothetical protein
MNCTICGKSTLPGAMLCAPCKAALKRARYVTVQDDLRKPSIIDARRMPRRARPAGPAPVEAPTPVVEPMPVPDLPPPQVLSNRVLGRRIYIGVFVAAVALGGASYFGQRELGAHAQDDYTTAGAPVMPAETRPETVAVTAKAASAAVPIPTATVAPPPAEASPSDAEPAPATLPPVKPVAAPSGKRAVSRASSFATVSGDPPDAFGPPPEPPKIVVAAAPLPPPAPDRWQSLRDSIALCDREGLFTGIICGQKARIQYCEGYWGKVPQCPGPTANPER